MSQWLSLFDAWAAAWATNLWRASWQGTLVVLLVLLLVSSLRGLPAWAQCWLWRFVYLKLIVIVFCVPAVQVYGLSDYAPLFSRNSQVLAAAPVANADVALAALATTSHDEFRGPPRNSIRHQDASIRSSSPWFRSPQLTHWSFVFWLCGLVLNAALIVRQVHRVARLKCEPLSLPWLEDARRDIGDRYGLRRIPTVVVSPAAPSPMLIGIMRPTIVLPHRVVQMCSRDELRQIVSHELGHAKRADLWWNLLPAVVQATLFFHPLVWLAHRQWRLSREMACDEFVIARAGCQRDYASALVQIAALCSEHVGLARSVGSVSIFESSSFLKRRLTAMQRLSQPSGYVSLMWGCLLVLIAIVGVVPWQAAARAENRETSVESWGSNMGFEIIARNGRAESWGGGGNACALTLDPDQKRSGDFSARLTVVREGGFGTYTQCISADGLQGKRVALKGDLKTAEVDGLGAGLWMRVDGERPTIAFDNMIGRRLTGTTPWRQYSVVLDVPANATKICFGILQQGTGTTWADNLQLAVAGPTDEPTGGKSPGGLKLAAPSNMSFETATGSLPASWGGGGEGYQVSLDRDDPQDGLVCVHLRSLQPDSRFATMIQGFKVGEFAGRQVKLTGYLKTKNAARAGLWMRVDGEAEGKVKTLSFDNMQTRPVTGTTDWTRYAVVLDVPADAVSIDYGLLLIGAGEAWGDHFHFETLGPVQNKN